MRNSRGYTPGKPNSGGPQLKFKFVTTLSAVVAKINVQRSVELGLFNGRSLVSCGNVTIPANHDIPAVGAVVEVRYLYAARESGVLYQPVYLGPREYVVRLSPPLLASWSSIIIPAVKAHRQRPTSK